MWTGWLVYYVRRWYTATHNDINEKRWGVRTPLNTPPPHRINCGLRRLKSLVLTPTETRFVQYNYVVLTLDNVVYYLYFVEFDPISYSKLL